MQLKNVSPCIGWALARLASLLLRSSLLFILIGVVGAMAVVCLLDLTILSDDPHRLLLAVMRLVLIW